MFLELMYITRLPEVAVIAENAGVDRIFMDMALNRITQQLIANQHADGVDAVSGATYSSNAIIKAAKSALQKAARSASTGMLIPCPSFFAVHGNGAKRR